MKKICIVGAGSWGTALALTAHRAKQQVTLLARDAGFAETLNKTRENQAYLPGIALPTELNITSDLSALTGADVVLQVTPAQSIRETCVAVKTNLPPSVPWVICAKGIAQDPREEKAPLLSDISQQVLPNPVVVLSGPSFADEVGQNLPTAVTIASTDDAMAKVVASSLRHPGFRCYVSNDPRGVQVAGALKNILAIACGIVRGKGLGNNAAAALITRGLAEMRRFGLAFGGRSDTFLGLAAVGDVTLTCSSIQSRNMRLGMALAKADANVAQILSESASVTEGVPTVAAVHRLLQTVKAPMPICQGVYDILYNHTPIDKVINAILSNQSESEFS